MMVGCYFSGCWLDVGLGEVEVEGHPLDLSQHELLAQVQTLWFHLAAPLVNKCAAAGYKK